jgi:MraZ protein
MFLGEYRHTLDDKNRVSLPAKFRKALGKKIIITRGLDRCLSVYSFSEGKKYLESLEHFSDHQANNRAFNRFMLSGATETEIDSAGRILIPDFLKQEASLGSKIVITGARNRIEIWNEEQWGTYLKKVESEIETLAEGLSTLA